MSKMSSLNLPPNPFPSTPLGTVLVIGGTGGLGSAIVHHLLTSPFHATTCEVHVLSRNAPSPSVAKFLSIPGTKVKYHHMSITDADSIRKLIGEIKPVVVFHTFSPRYTREEKVLYECNVAGMTAFLKSCSETPSVKAIVYSSSDSVMEVLDLSKGETIITEETCRLVDPQSRLHDPYRRTKTIADALVLKANSASLKTAALRFGLMYGPGDTQNLPTILDMLKKGQQKMQVGPNTTLREFIYLPSNAYAHVLAAQALLNGKGVDGTPLCQADGQGEVFLISDKPGGKGALMFWDWTRMVWKAAGDETKKEEVSVLPIWLAMFFMGLTEWIFWLGTAGYKKPEVTRAAASYMFMPMRVDCTKAVRTLGFTPLVGLEEGVQRSVDWMKAEGWTKD